MSKSSWFHFTASQSMKLVAQATPDSPGLMLGVYTGQNVRSLHEIGCQDFYSTDQPVTVVFPTSPGTTYYVQVSAVPYYSGGTGTFTLFEATAPVNDDFVDRVVLQGFPVTHDAGNNAGATNEPGEPLSKCIFEGGDTRSMWFEWTPASSGVVVFDGIGGHTYSAIDLYVGSSITSLTHVACTSFRVPKRLEVAAGQTYVIQASGAYGAAGKIVVSFSPQVQGDDFDQATEASVGQPVTADLLRATQEPGEPLGCVHSNTVWFKLSGYSGVLKATPSGSLTALSIFESDRASSVGCTQQYGAPAYFEAKPDKTYYFQLSTYAYYLSPSDHSRSFLLEPVAAPANDDFADAQQVPQTGAAGSNLGATTDPGDPVPNCGRRPGATVWYKWTADATRRFVVDTLGSTFDTILGAYTGDGLPNLTQVACNDDHNTYQSRLVLDAQAGETYFFQVSGYSSARGNVSINLGTDPLNDDLAEAEEVTEGVFLDVSANRRATNQPNEPAPTCNGTGETVKTLWYRYTPSTPGPVEIDTLGSTFDTVVAVYTGSAIQSLSQVACNEDVVVSVSQASLLSFTAVPGQTYYIQVGGWKARFGGSDTTSNGDLSLRVTQLGV